MHRRWWGNKVCKSSAERKRKLKKNFQYIYIYSQDTPSKIFKRHPNKTAGTALNAPIAYSGACRISFFIRDFSFNLKSDLLLLLVVIIESCCNLGRRPPPPPVEVILVLVLVFLRTGWTQKQKKRMVGISKYYRKHN